MHRLVGILLCSGSTERVVRYAPRAASAPMAVATYTYDALPPDEQAALPPAEAVTAAFTLTDAASGTATTHIEVAALLKVL